MPFLAGTALAYYDACDIRWAILGLSVLAVILIMLATYFGGEYFDFATDSMNTEYNRFSGGSRILPQGLIASRKPLIASYISLASVCAIGLVLFLYFGTGPFTIPLGAFGLMCGFFYTAPPFRWSYHSIGELLIAICYGWLTVNTAYYLQTGQFSLLGTLVSIPFALSIFIVILINEFPDRAADHAAGKRTLVVRFGEEKMAKLYLLFLLLSFAAIPVGIIFGLPKIVGFLSLALISLLYLNIKAVMKREFRQPKPLEKLCLRTIVYDLSLGAAYILGLLVA